MIFVIIIVVGIVLTITLEYRERLVDNVQMHAWNYARPVYYSLPTRWGMVLQLNKWTLRHWGIV